MNPPNAPSAAEDLAVILAGAGEGVRMGGLGPKLLIPIGGRTLLHRVAATFLAHPAVGEIVAAVPERLVNDASHAIESIPNPRRIPIDQWCAR